MPRAFEENLDLIGLCLFALGMALIALLWPEWSAPPRVALGLVVALIAPGYALVLALLPNRAALDGVERLALSLGLSVVVIPLLGLLLNITPWGLRLLPMALGLAAFILLTALLALVRRRQLIPEQRFFAADGVTRRKFGQLLLLIGFGFGATVFAAQLLRLPGTATEFYLFNAEGKLEAYPTTVSTGQPFVVTLGISNHEARAESFRILAPFAGEEPVAEVAALPKGQNWEEKLTFRAPEGEGLTQLTFELYRLQDTKPFRLVHFFVTLSSAQVEACMVVSQC